MATARPRFSESVSPQEHLAELRSDYDAAKPSPLRRNRTGLGGSGDAHYAADNGFFKVMEVARDMDRNDNIIGWLLDRATNNAIQQGFCVEPDTGEKALDDDLKGGFLDWASDPDQCDSEGEKTFWQLEERVFRAVRADGDIFAIPQQDGTLKIMEAHRARTPSSTNKDVVHGVMLDEERKRVEYWFTKESNIPLMSRIQRVNDMNRIPARDPKTGERQVYHIYNPKRVSQTRGVNALVPIMDTAGVANDLMFAKLVQAQNVSCFVAAITEMETAVPGPGSKTTLGVQTTQADGRIVERITPGLFLRLKPGQDIKGFSPNVPNAEFFDHVNLLMTMICLNLGLPLIEGLMDGAASNFSGIRGAQSMARMGYKRNQKHQSEQFETPCYLRHVRRRLALSSVGSGVSGAVVARLEKSKRLFRHSWGFPRWDSIQPVDDATAVALRVSTLQSTLREELLNLGRNVEDIYTDTINDNNFGILLAHETAKLLKAKYPESDVTWRDFMPRDLPSGFSFRNSTNETPASGSSGQTTTSGAKNAKQ